MLPKPTSYKDVVYARPEIAQKVDDLVTNRLTFPTRKTGLLLWGPYGTGKSTLAKLLPGPIDLHRGGHATVLATPHKIQSGSNGTSFISSLSNRVGSVPQDGAYHYEILDEVDNLGEAAMRSLKNVMDGPTAIFIMTTNNLAQIDEAVVSRCHLIEMTKPPASAWLSIAKQALSNAGVRTPVSDERLLRLIDLCRGDIGEIDAQLDQLRLELQPSATPSPLSPSGSATNAVVVSN